MDRRTAMKGMAAMGMSMKAGALAAQDGFYVPGEDAPHERTFMQWPVSRAVHRDRAFLQELQAAVARVANAIAAFEPVTILADATHHGDIRRAVSGSVELWDIPTEDLWCRDSGPIFVLDGAGGRAVRHIRFNGWGNRQVHLHDGLIAERVAAHLGLPLLPTPLKGEGGGIEWDGHGTLIAHESSWVNDNRNPVMDRDAVEAALLDAYGAQRMIWAPGLRDEDITDYHIDALVRFIEPGRVLINLAKTADPWNPFDAAALETYARLQETDLKIEVVHLPERPRVRSVDFVSAYANYYLCNGAVIAAEFGDAKTDAAAAEALARFYPGREVVTLEIDALGLNGGGIHCATQQMPAI